MAEYLELESGGTFLLLEDGELLELDEGAVFVAGNAQVFSAVTQSRGWTSTAAGAFPVRQASTRLATAGSGTTWGAGQNKTWH